MKKLILFLLVIFTIFSCTKSPENQAKENVEKYIKTKLDDPKSYESVSFGKFQRNKSTFKDDEKYKSLILEAEQMDKKVQNAYDFAMSMTHAETIKSATDSYKRLESMQSSNFETIKKFEKEYVPVDIYKIKHSYRAKNKMGGLVLDSCIAVLDTTLNVKYIQ